MFKRISLFAITNIAVLLVLGIVLRLLGIDRMIDQSGAMNFQSLMIFSLVWGMTGSVISLAMSKWSAKRMTGCRIIESPQTETERWLIQTVERQAGRAGIGMPEVAIYDSPVINAFATGARRNSALVAVSTGLMQSMSQDEAEAVLGHEISHVANGDMITLTLLQGVLNAFVIFLSRLVAHLVGRGSGRGGMSYFLVSMVLQVLLGFVATMVVRWFSRYREFRADSGGADLAGRDKMIRALEKLGQAHAPADLPEQMSALGISGDIKTGFRKLFSTHPPLTDRIRHLQQLSS
ncbi:MAG: protease HtpX [Gammaproteobacteria bacterium]|nr:protease HtpX [Gammaproteobacteria bacterium]MDH3767221.1 protease HtpX [Gammaproteobacteria bacterium]